MIDSPSALLTCRSLGKAYGAVDVLRDCSLQFHTAEIHALLGANGAGKSTLVRIISGLVQPTYGSMELSGETYAPSGKRAAEAAGIQIVQQELNLIPTLSVAENLYLNRLPATCGVLRQGELKQKSHAALNRFRLTDIDSDVAVGALGIGRQQMIEIVAALIRECRLLILDEPTAALSFAESETLFEWLRQLRSEGVSIVYISHRLDEVRALADRTSILRDGRHVGTWSRDELTPDEMVGLMTGESRPASQAADQPSTAGESIALGVHGLTGGAVHDVSFTVHQGERLGIAGLVGAGRTELLRLIYGADCADSGHLKIGNCSETFCFSHPADAVKHGIAMVTEDRKQDGLLLRQSIRANTTLASLWRRFSRAGVLRCEAEELSVTEMCQALETRCNDIDQTVETLSGGNQQKVVVARWLVRDADIFLFDEPTRGIDVAARQRIYRLFDSLSSQGKAIIIVSSDTEELIATCDRIAVMSNGRMRQIFSRQTWSVSQLMETAFAGYRSQENTDA